MNRSSVTIIGPGKVGTAFLNVLPDAGYQIVSIFSRDGRVSVSGGEAINAAKGLPQTTDNLGELILLTVSDAAIKKVSDDIADSIGDLGGKVVAHCSGTLNAGALQALKKKGASVASFHPIMSVTKATNSFEGIWFDIEGDEAAVELLQTLAEDVGAEPMIIDAKSKMYLHASAVVASNYLVALTEIAARISEQAGMDRNKVIQALLPLMQSTLNNLQAEGVEEALTGPIARADAGVVKKHLDILKKDVKLVDIYRHLGLFAAEVAERKPAGEGSFEDIKKLLS